MLKVIRRTASWATVAMMAVITTSGVALIVIGLSLSSGLRITPFRIFELDPVLWLAGAVAAVAPWWALAAAVVQQQHRRRDRVASSFIS